MASAQINARIDMPVKALGDRALESVGYTPTRAIRALWEFAGKNAHDRKRLRALLDSLEGNTSATCDDNPGAQARMARIAEGPLVIERALSQMGVQDPQPLSLSDDELKELAFEEKWAERGLM